VRHWPIVLVGLLGKVFGPIGFIKAWMDGRFESDFAWVILANDLIWWIPFSLILINAARHGSGRKSVAGAGARPEDGPLLRGAVTQDGQNLLDMSYEGPLLIVFLRHFGCTFCREAISELAAKQAGIRATGSRLVFLHRSEESGARTFFEQFGMEDVPRVADPDGKVYRSFGLGHGRWKQLFGWRVIQRAYEAGWVKGHGLGLPQGDVRQMPGVFLLYRGELVKSFRHRLASDQPDYSRMANIWPFNLTADAMRRQAGEQGDTGFGGLVSGIGNN